MTQLEIPIFADEPPAPAPTKPASKPYWPDPKDFDFTTWRRDPYGFHDRVAEDKNKGS